MSRGALDVDTLIKIVLLLVVVFLALEIVQLVLKLTFWFVRFFLPLVVLGAIVLVALYIVKRVM
ncbi:MAG: hypothetical protein ABEJ58_09875 [Halodesulfurarchaeum sp.]